MGSAREHVFTSQGQDVGELVSLKDDFVHLRGKDYWLPVSAIESVDSEEVRLRSDYDYLGGPQSGSKTRFVVSNATRMAILGMIARAAYSYRDERKRTQ